MVVAPNKKSVNATRARASADDNSSVFSSFYDVSPQDILKNFEVERGGDVASVVRCWISGRPSFESTTVLVNTLSKHFSEACLDSGHHRKKADDDARHKKLKETVYTNLLSYRKEYAVNNELKPIASPIDALSNIKANEVENLIWMTHVFVQQRRFDDANSLNKCLESLRGDGHLEADSDVRHVLKFLVALKGCGEKQEHNHQPARIMPRVIAPTLERPRFLPVGPLNYGDTYEYSAQHQYHYMHFPSDIFKISTESQSRGLDKSLPINKALLELPSASPGTGVNPMIFPKDDSEATGKVLGAMLQNRSGEMSPDVVLSVPELPTNPDEYCGFNHLARAPPLSPYGAVGSDEGYATRPSSRQIPEEDEEDVWERVLQEAPLTQRRTWENVGHPPVNKEKPFLSEVGPNAAHNMWIVYQELWSHLHNAPQVQPLCVAKKSQLCRDILYLLTGVPSLNFPWCNKCQRFIIKEGLCSPGITPGHLRTSLASVMESATYIRKLEVMSSPPVHSRKARRKGLVFHAFINAIANFLQVHRGKVLLLTGEHNLVCLLQKIQGLVRRVKFVSKICCISQEYETNSNESTANAVCTHESSSHNVYQAQSQAMDISFTRSQVTKPHVGVSLGLNLLGDLNSYLIVTKSKEYLMLLVYIMKSTCIPFFRYLEDWMYEGVCFDPELEFMIDVDPASLLHRDRRYWTHGYTLRDLSDMPEFLREVLEEAYACGKALNLLKICSPKHYLVNGIVKHPSVELCVSQEQLQKKYEECQAYEIQMEYLAAKNEVTAMQREDQLREEKQQLLTAATNKHSDAIKQIERKIEAARLKEVDRKHHELKELKEEMEKASERKRKQRQDEIEEDGRIALEYEEIEQKKLEHEEKLRAKIERYYDQLIKAAEQRETLARWKVDRCQLNEERKKFITNYEWTEEQTNGNVAEATTPEGTILKDECSVNVKIEVKPLFEKSNDHHLVTKDTNANEGLLKIDRDLIAYIEPSPTEESTSGCDMTVSRMSTSSDFVDTPHDENIPELEIDPDRSQVDSSTRVKPSFLGNPFGKKKQPFDSQLSDIQGDLSPGKDYPLSSDNVRIVMERNRLKVLREEYGIDVDTDDELSIGDSNANFSTPQVKPLEVARNDDENGNLGNDLNLAVTDELNSNLTQQPLKTQVNNTPLYPVNARLQDVGENDNNGNMYIPGGNDLLSRYQETRAEAALIKKKVLNQEFHTNMFQDDYANFNRSKPLISSQTLINRKQTLDAEYGMGDTRGAKAEGVANPNSYSRQVSSTSTSTYRSCQSYDRQTSASTVFSTPDEEKPILIDQVGGEVLKERGRSIHGHASDAVIHKLLCKHEPAVVSPAGSYSETTIEEGIISVQSVCKVQPYDVDRFTISGKEQILDICGSALFGKPSTAENVKAVTKSIPLPTINELACFPVNFVRSIKTHLASQNRLVNSSLLSEVLVQESLLEHFSALRAFLLLHDAHFARALILNLCTKIDLAEAPATLLTSVVMNSILSKSISESCWSSSPFADNLSFAVIDTPARFTSQTSILNCMELRYRAKWPHTLILDDTVLALYSRLWKFLASLHYSIWAADDVFCYTSFLSREDKDGNFVKSAQFHQICLYCHQMHHFLLVVQAYVTSQVHQTSWSDFEQKLRKKVSSIDELYIIHSDLVNAIVSRCFLNENGAVVLKLIHEVFSLMLQFRSQLKSHMWQTNRESKKAEHPVFLGLQKTYKEFKKHATFLHKMLEEEESKLPECY